MVEFGTNLALAVIGTAIYSLWMVRDKLRIFSFKIFFNKNKAFWVWVTCFQIAMAGLVAFSAESAAALKTLLGIDFTEATAFVTSGWILSIAANSAAKKKLGDKE